MTYFADLAKAEIAKGDLGSRELIAEYLKAAQESAKELAPYQAPKLTAIDQNITDQRNKVLRAPKTMTMEQW